MGSSSPRISTFCLFCSKEPLTVKYVLFDCPSIREERALYLTCCRSSNTFSLMNILEDNLGLNVALIFLSSIRLLSFFYISPIYLTHHRGYKRAPIFTFKWDEEKSSPLNIGENKIIFFEEIKYF